MATLYSGTYESYGLSYRVKVTYSYTLYNTYLHVSGTMQMQYKGTFNDPTGWHLMAGALGAVDVLGSAVDMHPGDYTYFKTSSYVSQSVDSTTSKSSWTNIGSSKSFAGDVNRSTIELRACVVTFIGVNMDYGYPTGEISSVDNIVVPVLPSYEVRYYPTVGSPETGYQTSQKYLGKTLTLRETSVSGPGYNLHHWNTSPDDTGTPYGGGSSYTNDAPLTLYEISTYSVYYEGNGITLDPDIFETQVKTRLQPLTLHSDIPLRDGYRFMGWNDKADGTGTTYSAGGSYSTDAPVHLYAIWSQVPYNPQIHSMSAVRCRQDGTQDDSGSYAKITVEWSVDTTSPAYPQNTGTVTGKIRVDGGTDSSFSFSSGASGTSGTAVGILPNIDTDSQYVVTAIVTDLLNSTSKSVILTRAFFVMDFKSGGRCMGIGSAAPPTDGLEIGYDTTFTGLVRGIFPIGSFFETIDPDFNPASLYGGTWTLVSSVDDIYRWRRSS